MSRSNLAYSFEWAERNARKVRDPSPEANGTRVSSTNGQGTGVPTPKRDLAGEADAAIRLMVNTRRH